MGWGWGACRSERPLEAQYGTSRAIILRDDDGGACEIFPPPCCLDSDPVTESGMFPFVSQLRKLKVKTRDFWILMPHLLAPTPGVHIQQSLVNVFKMSSRTGTF